MVRDLVVYSQDDLIGATVECGEDGWRQAHPLQSMQEVEML